MKNNASRINPAKRDYEIDDNGNIVRDEGLQTPAYYRLMVKRTQWLFAPNSDYGSDLYLLKKHNTSGRSSAVTSTASRALEPLLNQGRADLVNVDLAERARHGVGIEIQIREVKSNEIETIFLPIGR